VLHLPHSAVTSKEILPGLPIILRILHLSLSLGFTTVFFGMMFKILPDVRVEWRDVWLGAAQPHYFSRSANT
jgi:uncharacterized BrkB/YihY/UPF0761 family membrane protein